MGLARRVATTVATVVLAAALVGCAQTAPPPHPTPTAPSSASPTPSAAPRYEPSGTAADNKAYFDLVNSTLIASNGGADGRTIIDDLVKAGFDKSAMQVTPDKTPIGAAADTILFSVKIGGSCLLGQRSGGSYGSSVEAALPDGTCLIGKTRPIDW